MQPLPKPITQALYPVPATPNSVEPNQQQRLAAEPERDNRRQRQRDDVLIVKGRASPRGTAIG
jgi:hypothetical protein